ncbi:MAG: HD domain-containing protein [Candidatus Pacearchaeota archaeon]|nr:HD domain-containing protein [Candidatus Pacearchaeota archaeon]
MINITEKVRKFVEEECSKPKARYKGAFKEHFIPVVKYSLKMAEQENADKEILEIAAWLHDIGSIRGDPNNHHVSGAKIAEEFLSQQKYPIEKIAKVKELILSHRSSLNIKSDSKEVQILKDADTMAHFDNIKGITERVFNGDKEYTLDKLERSYNKLSDKAKLVIKERLEKVREELK